MFDFDLICENIYSKGYKIFFISGLMSPIPLLARKSNELKIYFKDMYGKLLYNKGSILPICISIRKDMSIITEKNIRLVLKNLASTHYSTLCIWFNFYDNASSLVSACVTDNIPRKQVEKDIYDIFKNSEVLYDYNMIDNYFKAL